MFVEASPPPPGAEARLRRIVDDVVQRAVRLVRPRQIWLFGSHANGTARRSSDVDLALRVTNEGRENWSRFAGETAERVPALIEVDLVDMDRCGPDLEREIQETGRLVYEAPQPG